MKPDWSKAIRSNALDDINIMDEWLLEELMRE